MTDTQNNIEVSENNEETFSELQLFGINSTVVSLLSSLRKYTILTQVQMDLTNKSHQIQPMMREFYQYEEIKAIMDIRKDFDMFYVYANNNKYVLKNSEALREKFEQAVSFITTNMQSVKNVLDKNYVEILDTFTDMLQRLSTTVATKSIFDKHFKIS